MPTILHSALSDGQGGGSGASYYWPGQFGLDDVAAYQAVKNKEGGSRRPRPGAWQPAEESESQRLPGEVTHELTFRSAIPRAPVDGCVLGKPAGAVYSRHRLPGRRTNSVVSEVAPPGKQRAEHFRNLSAGGEGATQTGGKETCRYFLRTGTCGYGDKCRYDHPKTAQKPDLNTLGYPLRQGECACRFFIKNGWCGFGPTCKFHHPELPARKLHSPGAGPMPVTVPGRFPPYGVGVGASHHMGGVHHQAAAAVYQPLISLPPGAPAMHMPQGMYPYMLMGGMGPMMPPVAPAWAMTPPDAQVDRQFFASRRHSAHNAGRESVSDESTASVVSSGYEHENDQHHEEYHYRSVMSPTNAKG